MIFETVFLLEKSYQLTKTEVREKLTAILALQGLHLAEKRLCLEGLDEFVNQNISYADAYNAAWPRQAGIVDVYSWDREYERLAGLRRIEP